MFREPNKMARWILLYTSLVVYNAYSIPTHDNRNAVPSPSLPDDVPMLSLKQNASIMACNQALVLPAMRTVHLTDSQMRDLMQNKGGNYLFDYMAATQEEALENFPNMLLVTDPSLGVFSGVPMSMYDNFIAKSILMEDLEKLKFYILNTTNESGKPNMGMYIVNPTVDTVKDTANVTDRRETSSQRPSQHPMHVDSVHVPTRDANTTRDGTASLRPTLSTTRISHSGQVPTTWTTTGNPYNTSTQVQSPPTPPTLTTLRHSSSAQGNKDNTHSPTDPGNSIHHSPTDKGKDTDTSTVPTSSSEGNTFTSHKVPSDVSTTEGAQGRNTKSTSDPLISLTSTVDPDVLKSLAELNKYLAGLGGFSQSDLTSAMREIQTTMDPDSLIRLANKVRRRKRNTDGSTTHENYCQLKGSPTDDRQYVHICSSCAATTQLPEDFFPRYINEVVCKTGDTDCFKIGDTVHGRCKQRYFTLNMLRKSKSHCMVMMHNGESLVLDNWELVPKRIRVSCECTINKLSFLKPYVAQDAATVG